MKNVAAAVFVIFILVSLTGCGAGNFRESVENTDSAEGETEESFGQQKETAGDFGQQEERQEQPMGEGKESKEPYTADTPIAEVISNLDFGTYGRLIFPADSGYYSGDTLGALSLTWYSNMDPDKTVEIANYMKTQAEAGEMIFYDIYTQEEKEADPAKEDGGLVGILRPQRVRRGFPAPSRHSGYAVYRAFRLYRK